MYRPLLFLLCFLAAEGQLPSSDKRFNVVAKEAEPDSVSILSTIKKSFDQQMHNTHTYSQEVNGAVGLAFGLVLLLNGNRFFRLSVAFVVGVAVYFSMENELAIRYHSTLPGDAPVHTTLWMKVIALELAVLIAYICGQEEDFEGIKKIVGIALGLSFFGTGQFAMINSDQSWMHDLAQNTIFSLVVGTCFIFGGFYLMAAGTVYVVAILAPAAGSILVSSSIFYWVSYVQNLKSSGHAVFWIDYVNAMNPQNPNIGLVPGHIEGISVNRICSIGLAVIIFLVSAYLQVHWAIRERREHTEGSSVVKDIRNLLFCVPTGKRSMSSTSFTA